MIPAWLSLVLDRLLPDLTGGQRDEMACAIVAAIPLSVIELAVSDAAVGALHRANIHYDARSIARAIASAAAPRIVVALAESP